MLELGRTISLKIIDVPHPFTVTSHHTTDISVHISKEVISLRGPKVVLTGTVYEESN